MDHTVWVLPSRYFARQGYRVLAVDLPGHGRSEGPALTSIEAMSDWLDAACAALDVGTAAVVGHSMGSLVAYRFAVDHGERCRAIALLGTSVPMPVTPILLDAAADDDHAAIEMTNAWSHSPRGTLGGNRNPGVWMLAAGERLIERSRPRRAPRGPRGLQRLRSERGLRFGRRAGARDRRRRGPLTPMRAGLDVARALPDARVVRLEGCGHAMLSERPNEVLDALIEVC